MGGRRPRRGPGFAGTRVIEAGSELLGQEVSSHRASRGRCRVSQHTQTSFFHAWHRARATPPNLECAASQGSQDVHRAVGGPRHRPRARGSPQAEVKGARRGAQSLRTRLSPPPAPLSPTPHPSWARHSPAACSRGRALSPARAWQTQRRPEPHRGWQGERFGVPRWLLIGAAQRTPRLPLCGGGGVRSGQWGLLNNRGAALGSLRYR